MREILFKAKRMDNGEWVEGHTVRYGFTGKEKWYIVPQYASDLYAIEIDQSTICQYTGLTDKNGNMIWENDIVFVTDGDGCSGSSDTGVGEIDFLLGLWYVSGSIQNGLYDVLEVLGHEAEVIGNTFDNADLLKGEYRGEINL